MDIEPTPSQTSQTPASAEPKDERRAPTTEKGPDRRASRIDRRVGLDRRILVPGDSDYTGPDRRSEDRRDDTGLERRRGPGRRRPDERRTAEEGEMNTEQFEFVMAIETYKKVNHRLYPTWTEILEIVQQLGYRKTNHRNIELDNVPEPDLQKVA